MTFRLLTTDLCARFPNDLRARQIRDRQRDMRKVSAMLYEHQGLDDAIRRNLEMNAEEANIDDRSGSKT